MPSYQIDRDYWANLTIFEQMGNIGAEVGRSINAYRAGNMKRYEGAFDRALDLFDATIEVLVKNRSYRLKEVLVARDEYCRLFFEGTFDTDADALERYFMNFAIAARKGAKDI